MQLGHYIRLAYRVPFSFVLAKQMGKTVQACVIDYLPDRQMLEWDVSKPMGSQLVKLFGRARIDVSLEFMEPDHIKDPEEAARNYHDMIQKKLEMNLVHN